MRYLLSCWTLFAGLNVLTAQEQEPIKDYYIFSIYFGGGSYYVTPDQEEELYKWLDGIPGVEHHQISVHSHTDNIGSKEYNDWLSQMRSDAAIEKLINHGISPDRISIEDFGELNPVYDNSTWEGKLKNRRVDIIIKPVEI
ncbi:MAG: OmpA family protein [Saprospiraceae bacterium]